MATLYDIDILLAERDALRAELTKVSAENDEMLQQWRAALARAEKAEAALHSAKAVIDPADVMIFDAEQGAEECPWCWTAYAPDTDFSDRHTGEDCEYLKFIAMKQALDGAQ